VIVIVLKRFKIYLHQLTPNAIIRLGIFIWAMWSQGVEPDAEAFCEAFARFMNYTFRRRQLGAFTITLITITLLIEKVFCYRPLRSEANGRMNQQKCRFI
jgi:hypothetical protein